MIRIQQKLNKARGKFLILLLAAVIISGGCSQKKDETPAPEPVDYCALIRSTNKLI